MRPLHADGADKLDGLLPRYLNHLLVEVTPRDIQTAGKLLYGEFRLADVLFHNLDGLFYQLLVQRSNCDPAGLYPYLPVEQLLPFGCHFDNLVDAQLQHAHVERLGDIIVRPYTEPFQLVLLAGFGSEQDDGDMGVAYIVFDGSAQLQPVHFGHHDVAHHQVDVLPFEHAQRLLPVHCLQHLILL